MLLILILLMLLLIRLRISIILLLNLLLNLLLLLDNGLHRLWLDRHLNRRRHLYLDVVVQIVVGISRCRLILRAHPLPINHKFVLMHPRRYLSVPAQIVLELSLADS